MTTHHAPSTEAAEEEREAVRPARRWRNKWRAMKRFRQLCGTIIDAGHEDFGMGEWPTKELAEQAALEHMRANREMFGKNLCVYLGAHPVDGQGGGG